MSHRALFLFLLSLAVSPAEAGDAKPAKPPNFVVILADDMGWGDAACYGGTRHRTPHLDRLAKNGMRFTDFHSSGTVCSPTRAGLLTGRYQQRAGIPGVVNADPKVNRHHGLHTDETTFAELLRAAGYRTAIFGKWHLGYETRYNPKHHGFDRFRGFVSGNIDYQSHVDRMGFADWWDGAKLRPEDGYSTHLVTKHAVQFIDDNHDKPFGLYVAHEAPHSPYQGPGDKPVRRVRGKERGGVNLPQNVRKDVRAAYGEMLAELDKGVGEIVAALKRRGIEDNTLVLFFSDNGANRHGSNGGLRGFKGSVWEGGHRVPAIAYWPGKVKAGTVSDATAISLDVMPTMLELAGVNPPEKLRLDGVSLVPVLTGRGGLPERTLFWEMGKRAAVRRGKWKLTTGERGLQGPGLFDLERDPSEETNVVADHPKRVAELTAALSAWRKDVAAGATQQPDSPGSTNTR